MSNPFYYKELDTPTVRELIEELKKFDPEDRLVFQIKESDIGKTVFRTQYEAWESQEEKESE